MCCLSVFGCHQVSPEAGVPWRADGPLQHRQRADGSLQVPLQASLPADAHPGQLRQVAPACSPVLQGGECRGSNENPFGKLYHEETEDLINCPFLLHTSP